MIFLATVDTNLEHGGVKIRFGPYAFPNEAARNMWEASFWREFSRLKEGVSGGTPDVLGVTISKSEREDENNDDAMPHPAARDVAVNLRIVALDKDVCFV